MGTTMTSCTGTGTGTGSSGGGVDWGWDDYDDNDDWYNDDDDDDWYDSDDDYDDDWGSDDDWDDDWDTDDDGCPDCGDDWGWFDDAQNGTISSDIMGEVAAKEQAKLKSASEFYTNKFNLSNEQSLKLAKTIYDYKALGERNAQDLADFSQTLYGLNPEEIITSVSAAQVGDHSKLDATIKKAAKNFNTTTQNMREIVKTLHGRALQENGIEL